MSIKYVLASIFLFCTITGFSQSQRNVPQKILMVVSSYGKDQGNTRPAFEMDEFTQAYLIFKANGLDVVVASPKGGAVEPGEYNKKKPYNQAVINDSTIMQLLATTKSTASIKPEAFQGIYVVGGKGAMFDIPYDPALQDIILHLYKNNKVVSAVCHGPAALANIKLNDSTFLLAGKAVSGFSNEEEKRFGKKWMKEFPFLLEDKLKERGAQYKLGDMMLPQVTVSGKLITGQNPYSTSGVAEAVVQAMGKQPVARSQYADEKSMNLVKQVLAEGFAGGKAELEKNKDKYDIELIAVYGYYQLIGADNDTAVVRSALRIIELATPYMFNENLQYEMAKGYIKLHNKETAKRLLNELLVKVPGHDKAKTLLKELEP